jgi:LuxR family transcriptional regulator, maltose regulon positive regulatory protein
MHLLEKKLAIPPQPLYLISRTRLLKRLDDCCQRSLTLVLAPAGAGKTTLLSEWGNSRKSIVRIAWISLSREENDPQRFWRYIIAAIRPHAAIPGFLDWLQKPGEPNVDEIDNLIAWIGQSSEQEFVLIFDDFHVVTARPVQEIVAYFLKYLPANMHIVIASRSRPSVPTAQMRLSDQLMEINGSDLKFTLDETEEFLFRATLINLSHEHIERIHEQVEGWAAGLWIVALSLRSEDVHDLDVFFEKISASDGLLVEYFMEQVFRDQDEHVQEFLLSTAVLKKFNVSLCQALTENFQSMRVMRQLEQSNLFLARLDGKGEWYRYHRLFAHFLEHKLQGEFESRYLYLHKKAAGWFEVEGCFHSALAHASKSGDTDLIGRLARQMKKGSFDKDVMQSNRPLIEALSGREMQILLLIAEGKSHERVANELVVAVSTIRWHIKNIYRKLGVHSGIEAVSTAKAIGILY